MHCYAKYQVIDRELERVLSTIETDASAAPADIDKGLRYLRAHLFDEELSVQRMLDACSLSSHGFYSRFAWHVGMSPRCYNESRRMRAAIALLRVEEIEIYRIAFSIGYSHHESFTRAFRRCVGCAPSVYREHLLLCADAVRGASRHRPGPPVEKEACRPRAKHERSEYFRRLPGTVREPKD